MADHHEDIVFDGGILLSYEVGNSDAPYFAEFKILQVNVPKIILCVFVLSQLLGIFF